MEMQKCIRMIYVGMALIGVGLLWNYVSKDATQLEQYWIYALIIVGIAIEMVGAVNGIIQKRAIGNIAKAKV